MKELGRIAREEDSARDDAEARELLRPFSPEELRGMAESATKAVLGEGPEGTVVRPAEARGRARWAGTGRPLAIGAFVVAAAAALLFWMRTAPPAMPDGALASYELVVEGGERPTRAGDPVNVTEPVRVARDGRLVIVARPAKLATGVGAAVWIARGESLAAWSVTPQVSVEGAVRVEAGPSAIAELPEGSSRLVVFVGAPSALPSSERAARDVRRAPPAGVRVLERALDVAPR